MKNCGCGFGGIAGLVAVEVALKSCGCADRCVVVGMAFSDVSGDSGEVGAKAAGFDDCYFHAQRAKLLREDF